MKHIFDKLPRMRVGHITTTKKHDINVLCCMVDRDKYML